MKITNIEIIPVELPLVRAHRMAYNPGERIGKFSLVRMDTDEGITGWGEAPTEMHWGGDYGTYYGESQKTTVHLIKDFLEPLLKGEDPFRLESLYEKMNAKVKGYPYAKAAVEIALLDIIGKAKNISVSQLLFGAFHDEIPIQHSIGLMTPEEAAREAALVAEEGIRTLKIKIGVEPERDVETVRRVREAVGPNVQIRVDGNRGYRCPHEAVKVLRRMEAFDLLLAEQPVEGIEALAQVAGRVDVPLMADESVWTARDVRRIREAEAAQYLNVYITKSGGLIRAKKLIHTASALGLQCGAGGMVELGIANAANLHFAGSSPEITLACGFPVPYPGEGARKSRIACSYYRDTLEKNPPEFKNGCLGVPKGPGLGIEIDEKKIQRYRI